MRFSCRSGVSRRPSHTETSYDQNIMLSAPSPAQALVVAMKSPPGSVLSAAKGKRHEQADGKGIELRGDLLYTNVYY